MKYMAFLIISMIVWISTTPNVHAAEDLELMGWVTVGTGTVLTLAAWNWRSDCKKGLEESYLGYDCYADTDKVWHTSFQRPKLLVAGLATGTVGLYMLYRVYSKPVAYMKPGFHFHAGPNFGMLTYRFR